MDSESKFLLIQVIIAILKKIIMIWKLNYS